MHCFACGCANPSKFRCPDCVKLGHWAPASFFCSQECFKKSWKKHKKIHDQPYFGEDNILVYEHLVNMGHMVPLRQPRKKGFSTVGKLKGPLANLVKITICDILEKVRSCYGIIIDEYIPLFYELPPHQRLALLSDVCVGLLDPSAPLPPDTPEHHSAFLQIIDYWRVSLVVEIQSGFLLSSSRRKKKKQGKQAKKEGTKSSAVQVASSEKQQQQQQQQEAANAAEETTALTTETGSSPPINAASERSKTAENLTAVSGSTSITGTTGGNGSLQQETEQGSDVVCAVSAHSIDKLSEKQPVAAELTSILTKDGPAEQSLPQTEDTQQSSAVAKSADSAHKIKIEERPTTESASVSTKDAGSDLVKESQPLPDSEKEKEKLPTTFSGRGKDFVDEVNRNHQLDEVIDRRQRRALKKKVNEIEEKGDTSRIFPLDNPMAMLNMMLPLGRIVEVVNNIDDARLGFDGIEDDDEVDDDDVDEDNDFEWRRAYSAYMRESHPFFSMHQRACNEEIWEARHRMVVEDLLPLDDEEHTLLVGELSYRAAPEENRETLVRFAKMSRLIEEKVADFNSKWTRHSSFWAERSLDLLDIPEAKKGAGLRDYLSPENVDEAKQMRSAIRLIFEQYPGEQATPYKGPYDLENALSKARMIWTADWHEHMAREGRQYDNITHRLDALREMHAEAEAAEKAAAVAAAAAAAASGKKGVNSAKTVVADTAAVEVSAGDGGGAAVGSGTRLLLNAPVWAEVTGYKDENQLSVGSAMKDVLGPCGFSTPTMWKLARDLSDKEVVCANKDCYKINIEFANDGVDDDEDTPAVAAAGGGTTNAKNQKQKKHRRNAEVVGITKFKRCAVCGVAAYCSPKCQRDHWPKHKPDCQRWKGKVEEKTGGKE